MNARRSTHNQKCDAVSLLTSERRAFTLLEVLVVISIIGILIGAMGGVITNSFRKARESATVALLLKIEGLLDERTKGFERATKSRDFQRVVTLRQQALEAAGFFGVSPKVIEVVARKDFYRANFPQRFEELADTFTPPSTNLPNGVPDIIDRDPQVTFIAAKHNRDTESSALLYYMLNKMQVFGVPPVGESVFESSEFRDTDGDGLLEFVDGWGRPLRFYRWPTRLLKPNGLLGADGQPGISGVNDDAFADTTTDDFDEFGTVGTDDVNVPPAIRSIGGLLLESLPRAPVVTSQWDTLSEDPDDPYGLISTEIKRLYATGINVMVGPGAYNEPLYPTIDTYHTPLIVSLGPDNDLGLFEPYFTEDVNGNGILDPGEDTNSNGILDIGILAQPRDITIVSSQFVVPPRLISALSDNLTNRNRRAGRGK